MNRNGLKTLGKFPLPVEVVQFGWERTFEKLQLLGCEANRRMNGTDPYLTDNGNYIIDCAFDEIKDPPVLHEAVNAITGCGGQWIIHSYGKPNWSLVLITGKHASSVDKCNCHDFFRPASIHPESTPFYFKETVHMARGQNLICTGQECGHESAFRVIW